MPKNQLKKHNSPTPRISYLGNPMPQKKALKDIADFVAPPVEEDGAAVVIEKFLLK